MVCGIVNSPGVSLGVSPRAPRALFTAFRSCVPELSLWISFEEVRLANEAEWYHIDKTHLEAEAGARCEFSQ